MKLKNIQLCICTFLCKRSRRYMMYSICRVMGIWPYKWQSDYALGKRSDLGGGYGRATGKTTAVMLRMLMTNNPARVFPYMFNSDPDYNEREQHRKLWCINEYNRIYQRCRKKGIPVAELETALERRPGYPRHYR